MIEALLYFLSWDRMSENVQAGRLVATQHSEMTDYLRYFL